MLGLQEWAITTGSLGACFPPWLGCRAGLTLFPLHSLVPGCKLWPPPQSWPGCQTCSLHPVHRISFKSVSQPSPLPQLRLPRAPWCAPGQGWSFTGKAWRTLLIHTLMPVYPVTLRPGSVGLRLRLLCPRSPTTKSDQLCLLASAPPGWLPDFPRSSVSK